MQKQQPLDLPFAAAYEMAAAIRDKQISAVELLDAHLTQIARHNSALNVIVTLDEERAKARAQEADAAMARNEVWGPFHGVPFTVKDGFATAGLRTTSSNPSWADYVPQSDAPTVARLRAAGGILMGKTNLPRLSSDAQVDSPIFGRTSNPWDLSRTCGGSTGGAAAVAAGLTPLELGSDIGGSVRIPAHFCGISSLKPTDYRFPEGGYHPNPGPTLPETGRSARLAVFGPLARSLDDLILAFEVLAIHHGDQWMCPPVPTGQLPDLKIDQLRLAWSDDLGGVQICADIREALARLAGELDGHVLRIEHTMPAGFGLATVWETYGELVGALYGLDTSTPMGAAADPLSEVPLHRGMAHGNQLTLQEYRSCLRARGSLITVLELLFEQWDALILPVTSTSAFQHCSPNTPILVDGQPLDYWIATIGCTSPFNLTGHPVVTMPITQSHEGLPIGVQIVGQRWGEMKLLAIAKQISELIGPFQRPPGY